jgi:hypothetical protein
MVGDGCGILDTDFEAAFDFLVMDWAFLVLKKKNLATEAIERMQRLYLDNFSIPVINNVQGRAINNKRMCLKQGDVPSMHFFAYAIEPMLLLMDRVLKGIPIYSMPTAGPKEEDGSDELPAEERYKVMGYADDAKPAITSIEEFITVDRCCALFEAASGCRLHRDPASAKCAFLPLGKWKRTLK